ncbi:MAG: hypothetical protein IT376_17280 [Polyangiaceae bacterium]|nr:hypothetical protein [Polyangiaceae bacterium]
MSLIDIGWAPDDDLSPLVVLVAALVILGWCALLAVELRRTARARLALAASGALAAVALLAAALRPVEVRERTSRVGPRVLVLVDGSRRLLLPSGAATRRDRALTAARAVVGAWGGARPRVLSFGAGTPAPLSLDGAPRAASELPPESDLAVAIAAMRGDPAERPAAVVVVSDGRLAAPAPEAGEEELRAALRGVDVPIHTVRVLEQSPADASVRRVRAVGAAVAHQRFALEVQVGCVGVDCAAVPVTVRELRAGSEPSVLATGVARASGGSATVQFDVVLERAGVRVVEVALEAPSGDTIPGNDRRLIPFAVARDRLRLLHVAGRPTYDVRALRAWLEADESVDMVAFFILRETGDDPDAEDDELALIPFPVDELFTDHLPGFDAVILQDFDAVEYRLARHLEGLARYVEQGGGLILVGGPSAFAGGGYPGSALERVLPVAVPELEPPYDGVPAAPLVTASGRATPVLRRLLELEGEALAPWPGFNRVGAARPGALVLLEHPTQRVGTEGMPVLALGEARDGRAIALASDATHGLGFGERAAESAGRGHGLLWDGLLGWLMRDPRFEAASVAVVGDCVAGEPARLRVVGAPGLSGEVTLRVERLAPDRAPVERRAVVREGAAVEIDVGALEAGGYTARASVGAAPPARFDFACELGGDAWADSRAAPDLLERMARASGGRSVTAAEAATLPEPAAQRVTAERSVRPLAPPWVWALLAAAALGAHHVVRRRAGLA